jgi:hypothetical protein
VVSQQIGEIKKAQRGRRTSKARQARFCNLPPVFTGGMGNSKRGGHGRIIAVRATPRISCHERELAF